MKFEKRHIPPLVTIGLIVISAGFFGPTIYLGMSNESSIIQNKEISKSNIVYVQDDSEIKKLQSEIYNLKSIHKEEIKNIMNTQIVNDSPDIQYLKDQLDREHENNADLSVDIRALQKEIYALKKDDSSSNSGENTFSQKQQIKQLQQELASEKSKKLIRGDSSIIKNLRVDLVNTETKVKILQKEVDTLTNKNLELEKEIKKLEP